MARNPLTPFRSGRGLFGGDPFLSLHREVNRLFDDFLGEAGLQPTGPGQEPSRSVINASLDVSETDNELRVTAELPGVAEQDVEVTLNDDVLTIRGEKKFERKDEKENFHFVERSYGTFQRSLRLPGPVDPDQVNASFENGILTVTLPKTAQAERARRIQVQGRKTGSATGAANQGTHAGDGQSEDTSPGGIGP